MFPSSSLLSLDSPPPNPPTTSSSSSSTESPEDRPPAVDLWNNYQQSFYQWQANQGINIWNQFGAWNNFGPPTPTTWPASNPHQQTSSRLTPPIDHQTDPVAVQQTPVQSVPNPAMTASVMYTPESDQSLNTSNGSGGTPSTKKKMGNNSRKRVVVDIQKAEENDEEEDSDQVFVDKYMEVEGRLPSVGTRSKYFLDVEEVRRRSSEPESMNVTGLIQYFKKSKTKENCARIRSMIRDSNSDIKTMQRQKVVSLFTPLLEQEAVILADDLSMLVDTYMPYETVGKKTLQELLKTGKTPRDCLRSLRNSVLILSQIIRTVSTRQPAISGKTEIIKTDPFNARKDAIHEKLNDSYETFSRLTHGFGHASQLGFYKSYVKIFEEAILACEKLCRGGQMS